MSLPRMIPSGMSISSRGNSSRSCRGAIGPGPARKDKTQPSLLNTFAKRAAQQPRLSFLTQRSVRPSPQPLSALLPSALHPKRGFQRQHKVPKRGSLHLHLTCFIKTVYLIPYCIPGPAVCGAHRRPPASRVLVELLS